MKRETIPKGLMDELRKKLRGITPQAVYWRIHRIRKRYKPAISLVDGAGVLAGEETDIDLRKYYAVEQVDRIRGLIAERRGPPTASARPIVIRGLAPSKAQERTPPRRALGMTDREITEYLKGEFRYTRAKVAKRLKNICAGDQESGRFCCEIFATRFGAMLTSCGSRP